MHCFSSESAHRIYNNLDCARWQGENEIIRSPSTISFLLCIVNTYLDGTAWREQNSVRWCWRSALIHWEWKEEIKRSSLNEIRQLFYDQTALPARYIAALIISFSIQENLARGEQKVKTGSAFKKGEVMGSLSVQDPVCRDDESTNILSLWIWNKISCKINLTK